MAATSELIRVDTSMEALATETITDAFAEDEMTGKLGIPDRLIRRMYRLPVRMGIRLGEVHATSPHAEGVMVVMRGENANYGFREMIRSGALGMALSMIRIMANKTMRTMFQILETDRKQLAIGPFLYLAMLGVSPRHQGKGHAGALMRALIAQATAEGRAIYLETQTESNVRLYEHFGFSVIKHIPIAEGIQMWEMVRPA